MEDPPFFSTTVGIIGGLGRMGRWMAAHFERAGAKVLIADQATGGVSPEMVRQSQVLVLAVPISQVEAVMRRVGPYTRIDGLVMDVCSLKQEPMRHILAHARGEVLGTHPLFGPSAESMEGRLVFMCPGRGQGWAARLSGHWENRGAKLRAIEPEQHDRLMAKVQSLRHLWLLILGRTLGRLDYDGEDQRELCGPWFGGLLDMLEHQCAQPGELYAELAMNNPHLPRTIRALDVAVHEVIGSLEAGDTSELAGLFREVEARFAGQNDRFSLDAALSIG